MPISQIPTYITQSLSQFGNILTAETVGWFIRKFAVKANSWILIVSAITDPNLASAVIVRGPLPVNIIVGASNCKTTGPQLTEHLDTCVRSISIHNGLPAINFEWVPSTTNSKLLYATK